MEVTPSSWTSRSTHRFDETPLGSLQRLQCQLDLVGPLTQAERAHTQAHGTRWQSQRLTDLKARRRQTQWAAWNFTQTGHQWPRRTYQEALLEPPPGLHGGQKPKKNKKVKPTALHKPVQEHWNTKTIGLKTQCEALGIQANTSSSTGPSNPDAESPM